MQRLLALVAAALVLAGPATASTMQTVDTFESGPSSTAACPAGTVAPGVCTFGGAGTGATVTNTVSPIASRPGSAVDNDVLTVDANSNSFFGFLDYFDAGDGTWGAQDWTSFDTISFWMYGSNSNVDLFVDILDNRNPGSTTDDAERFTASFVDDFSGWQKLEFNFNNFVRKEIGNGAPNDLFGLSEVWGYALGGLSTNGDLRLQFDDVMVTGPHVDVVVPLPAALPLYAGVILLMGVMSMRRTSTKS